MHYRDDVDLLNSILKVPVNSKFTGILRIELGRLRSNNGFAAAVTCNEDLKPSIQFDMKFNTYNA